LPIGSRLDKILRLQPDWLSGPLQMIEGNFSTRTLANMHVALERVCEHSPIGEQHEIRKRVAQALIRCAKKGSTTLGALTEAGERELKRLKPPDKKTV
jgi:hypothetical protein